LICSSFRSSVGGLPNERPREDRLLVRHGVESALLWRPGAAGAQELPPPLDRGRQRADVLADHPGQHDLWRVGAAGWPALAASAQAPALALRQSGLLPARPAHRGSALRLPTLRFTPQRRQLGLARPAVAQDDQALIPLECLSLNRRTKL